MVNLKLWEKHVTLLTDEFVLLCFDEDALLHYFWVGGELGGVLCVGDYFFSFNMIVEFFRYNATPDQLFEFYDIEMENISNAGKTLAPINFKTFIKLNMKEATNDRKVS